MPAQSSTDFLTHTLRLYLKERGSLEEHLGKAKPSTFAAADCGELSSESKSFTPLFVTEPGSR
jgi:hypothetical protein